MLDLVFRFTTYINVYIHCLAQFSILFLLFSIQVDKFNRALMLLFPTGLPNLLGICILRKIVAIAIHLQISVQDCRGIYNLKANYKKPIIYHNNSTNNNNHTTNSIITTTISKTINSTTIIHDKLQSLQLQQHYNSIDFQHTAEFGCPLSWKVRTKYGYNLHPDTIHYLYILHTGNIINEKERIQLVSIVI